MLQTFKNGQGSIIVRPKLLNTASTVGAGLTGLTSGSSGLIISTIADNESTPTTYTVAGSTIETITTLGTYAAPTATKCRFKEVDSTNHKGIYEFHFADARYAVSNAKSLLVSVSGASGLQEMDFLIQLQSDDPYVAKGVTAVTIAPGGIVAGANSATELNAIADAILDRNMATGTDSGTNSTAVRTVRQALRRLRNFEGIVAGVGTVCKEDDITPDWTYTAVTSVGNPISEVNPT